MSALLSTVLAATLAATSWSSGSGFSAQVSGIASATAQVTYIDGEEIRVDSMSVSDLRVDGHSVYAYWVIRTPEGYSSKTGARVNSQDANTTLTWRNLRITDKHYGLKKLQLVVCVDDWGTDTCRASGVQVNPRF
ncbi:hypothetical protein [Nonomuraea sp. NPDC046570]|uniref:hypothetical protein n=1 Tax=Nonomuraea sp. NPDC046570 TaxID=3155255 RepID=UPI0033EE52DC